MNPLIIRAILIFILSIGSYFYVNGLNHTISNKEKKIAELELFIEKQNIKIDDANKDKKHLEEILSKTNDLNKKLSSDNKKLKNEIDSRPDAKTCEEAVNYLSDTAKNVADEWNKK